ncbi:hypothetical protein [Pseudolactococcus insecticola]|uniref:Uncharacterized protein n=1 Tax=Pseudolactococcus insecticola TaxID=2709158 RepID=A0A6A0B9I3_9LACT|nr:hypothetical protein [Lactococcus insecticola]GFH41098.1 hypothetical protein Hs20B_14960 [Lactococcus insecticola]
MQKWGWGFVSLGLLIFITTLQSKGAFVIVSLLVIILGIGMIVVGGRNGKLADKSEKGDDNGTH